MNDPIRSPFAAYTGRGVRVALIDSGVNPAHPHVGGVAGGVNLCATGEPSTYLDFIGHGTAVAGAIREKAPAAELYAVKVFDQALRTNAATLLRALEWAIEHEMHVINLSLGTPNQTHHATFAELAAQAAAHNLVIVAAHHVAGQPVLPGCLSEVIGVELDWDCPRQTYRYAAPAFAASGYPRAIPGVPIEQNLSGISFAVANLTGFVARAREAQPVASVAALRELLAEAAQGAILPPNTAPKIASPTTSR